MSLLFLAQDLPMKSDQHNTRVSARFSPRAEAYLQSTVHASGEDLEQMVRLIGARPGAVALDMGCGGGHVAFRLASLVDQVIAYDLSGRMLAVVAEEARRRALDNIVTIQGSVEVLPYSAESFDIVVSRYSAHHWRDVPAGLAEMRRVLKPGGIAVFMDVTAPDVPLLDTWLQSLELLRDPSHVRDASLAEWQSMLTEAGFVPGVVTKFRLRLGFAEWIERMNTPEVHVAAIRSLQELAVDEIRHYFEIAADGSFTVDTLLMMAGTDAEPSGR